MTELRGVWLMRLPNSSHRGRWRRPRAGEGGNGDRRGGSCGEVALRDVVASGLGEVHSVVGPLQQLRAGLAVLG